MMRSLWTAASGMVAQQTNVDVISNNLSNINTTGYKKETTEFKSLLYQTLQQTTTDKEGNNKPVGAQVGLGVKTSAVTSQFDQGILTSTGSNYDLAISGNGFFMVQLQDGTIGYTRSGSFQTSLTSEGIALADSNGNILLDINKNPIIFDSNYNVTKMTINDSGEISSTGYQIGLVAFNNPAGLEKTSNSIFLETEASGEARLEVNETLQNRSVIKQGYLEGSNVQAVDEMVNLIVAQRAYEMNSKAITAADTMLQQANNLRG